MNIRAPDGRDCEPRELLIHVVDWIDDVSTLAGLFPPSRIERPTSVTAAIDLAARSRPDVVVLRVPPEEVARTDALRRLYAAAPACRVVLLPLRPVGGRRDRQRPAANDTYDHADESLSPAVAPAGRAVVRGRTLRPRADSAGLARQVVRSACIGADAGEVCSDALLVGSELVTNAVTHARSAVGLIVRAWPATVRIEVWDRLADRPAMRRTDGSSGGGRGLAITSALCSAWGIDPSAKGKTVWAQLVSPEPLPTLA